MRYLYEKCWYNSNLNKYIIELIDDDGYTIKESETDYEKLPYNFPQQRELLGTTYVLIKTEQCMNGNFIWKATWENKENYDQSVAATKE